MQNFLFALAFSAVCAALAIDQNVNEATSLQHRSGGSICAFEVDAFSDSKCQKTDQGFTKVNQGTRACINISNANGIYLGAYDLFTTWQCPGEYIIAEFHNEFNCGGHQIDVKSYHIPKDEGNHGQCQSLKNVKRGYKSAWVHSQNTKA